MLHKAALALSLVLGLLATMLPPVADAQQAKTVWRIGFLRVGAFPVNSDFRDAMRDLSWIEGQNFNLEPRFANNAEQLSALAAELVQLKVDVIITNGTPATRAAKNATTTIPIVFFLAADPVRNGIVASLARPGGNATGFAYGLFGHKMLETLRAALPGLTRVAYPVLVGDAGESASNSEFLPGAVGLGFQMQRIDVHGPEDFASFYAAARNAGADAVLIPDVPAFTPRLQRIGAEATGAGLPAIGYAREFADGGGLLYSGPASQHWPRLAAQIDKILKGANPADLPVEQPTRFELIVNLKAAKTLGVTIPQSLLLRADEVIQ
jgi:putative ABC transport system substrate-binding protein